MSAVKHRGIRPVSFVCIAALTAGLVAGCQRTIQTTTARSLGSQGAQGSQPASQMADFWVPADASRDLFWGPGGKRLAPDPMAKYTVIEVKRGGFSRGYTVLDPKKQEWSVKFPPEAPTEVAASRLIWGLGYHQPPVYYLAEWQAEKATSPNPQLPARFRQRSPDFHGLDTDGTWSYYRNPFVGTPQMNGLLVLHAMLGNSDLKDAQNAVYTFKEPVEGSRRWYVARDLGQTFGRTGLIDPPRGNVEVFEQSGFIKSVENGFVRFDYSGRHKSLFERIRPSDVRWICERVAALTDQQLQDVFRAAGYPKPTADRFIRRLKQKAAEGLRLKD